MLTFYIITPFTCAQKPERTRVSGSMGKGYMAIKALPAAANEKVNKTIQSRQNSLYTFGK